jgi:hypothetical protein
LIAKKRRERIFRILWAGYRKSEILENGKHQRLEGLIPFHWKIEIFANMAKSPEV